MQNMNIRNAQGGFTLIELVIVIVILGILAAVAVPRFINLSDEAEAAALSGVAGSFASAMAINFAGCSANSHNSSDPDCVTVDNCDDTGSIMQEGALPTGYTVAAAALSGNGTTATCTVTQTSTSNTATFTGIGAGQATP